MTVYDSEMSFPTMKEFEQKVYEKAANPISWKDVEVFEIYRIDEVMRLRRANSETRRSWGWWNVIILESTYGLPAFSRKHWLEKTLPCFIMPMGVRKCKTMISEHIMHLNCCRRKSLKKCGWKIEKSRMMCCRRRKIWL